MRWPRRVAAVVILLGAFAAAAPVLAAPPQQSKAANQQPRYIDVATGDSLFACALTDTGLVRCWRLRKTETFEPALEEGVRVTRLLNANQTVCAWAEDGSLHCLDGQERFARVGTFIDVAGWPSQPTTRMKQEPLAHVITADGALHALEASWEGSGRKKKRAFKTRPLSEAGKHTRLLEGSHPCAAKASGELYCRKGAPAATRADALRTGIAFQLGRAGCAVDGKGALRCAGEPSEGHLARAAPFRAIKWRMLEGDLFKEGCGIALDGALYCWGPNDHGQIGDGTFTERKAPVRVGTWNDWKRVVRVGNPRTGTRCGLRNNGSLYCWGDGRDGQLLNGRRGTVWFSALPARAGLGVVEQSEAFIQTPPLGRGSERISRCAYRARYCPMSGTTDAHLALRWGPDGTRQEQMYLNGANADVEACLRAAVMPCVADNEVGFISFAPEKEGGGVMSVRAELYPEVSAERRAAQPSVKRRPAPPPCDGAYGAPRPLIRTSDNSTSSDTWVNFDHFGQRLPLTIGAVARVCRSVDAKGLFVRVDRFDGEGGAYLGSVQARNGDPVGHWLIWDIFGRVLVDEKYKKGRPLGQQRRWSRYGEPAFSCQWKNGRRVGECVVYKKERGPNGPLIDEVATFDKRGRPTGTHYSRFTGDRNRWSVDFSNKAKNVRLGELRYGGLYRIDGGFVRVQVRGEQIEGLVRYDDKLQKGLYMLPCNEAKAQLSRGFGQLLDELPSTKHLFDKQPVRVPFTKRYESLLSHFDYEIGVTARESGAPDDLWIIARAKKGSYLRGTTIGALNDWRAPLPAPLKKLKGEETQSAGWQLKTNWRCADPVKKYGLQKAVAAERAAQAR